MAPLVVPVPLGPGVEAVVTGRARAAHAPTPRTCASTPRTCASIGAPGNLSHRRPHRPDDLRAARRAVGAATGTDPRTWHLMHQVHGANVAVVDEATPCGAELRGADGLVTALPGRALGVLSADCVPVLLAGDRTIAVAHAGRVGVTAGVVAATLATATELGEAPVRIRAVIGPAIGGCCYEVPGALRDEVGRHAPAAPTTTDRGTPGLDLPAAVAAQLADAGVTAVDRVGGCTRCDPEMRWFSHRRDPGDGRQLALIVRHEEAA